MRLPAREPLPSLPGVRGTLRTGRPTRRLLPRLRAGDVAVIDHADLDATTAQQLVAAKVTAVVNAQPMTSGRFPNRGPQILADAGIVLVEGVGEAGFGSLADGRTARIEAGSIYDGELRLTTGRQLGTAEVRRATDDAHAGLAAQLETLAHNSSELLRREDGLLLHGEDMPRLATAIADRPVLVVADEPHVAGQLRTLRSYLIEQRPVVIAVDGGAGLVQAAGLRSDVLVVGPEPEALPRASLVRRAREVIVVPGGRESGPVEKALERLGVVPRVLRTSLAPADAAVLMAHTHHAEPIIGAGIDTDLFGLLDGARPSPAGGLVTRLSAGPRLLDAGSVAALYSGPVRRSHLALALLVCLLVVVVAVALTPVGHDLLARLGDQLHRLGGEG